jgi:hypothetical protein
MTGKWSERNSGSRGTVKVVVRLKGFDTTVGLAQCFTESGLAGRRTRNVGVGVTVTLQCPSYRAAGFLESTGRIRNKVMRFRVAWAKNGVAIRTFNWKVFCFTHIDGTWYKGSTEHLVTFKSDEVCSYRRKMFNPFRNLKSRVIY